MYISLNWLKDFVDIKMDPKDLGNDLTLKTAEVEKVESQGGALEKMVAGQVLEIHPHPNADKLKLCKVSVGKQNIQVVCGGANLKEGMHVAIAKIGAKVKWHGEGELITMEKAKIRGEYSEGMICAGCEIGIDDPQAGPKDIMDLSSIKPKPGTPLAEVFGKDDTILEFDNKSLTHRPDLWGHYGIAREIAAITGQKLKPYKPTPKIPTKGETVSVKVEDHELCPRYCGLIINNVKVQESPQWLKNRLQAVDHNTYNNIVDVTNYISAELGQPMHAFDKSYIKKGIIVRRAKKGEKIKTLDDTKRPLTDNMLVIADHEKPVAIAGVMGGENSEINKGTVSIILEAATFNSSSIRKTATKLNLRTDAVAKFEKALDPNLPELAIKRAAELILKLCPGAEIGGPITDIKKFKSAPLKLTLNTNRTRAKIGIEISNSEIKKILESLEFKVVKKDATHFTVTVPTFRATKDVTIEDDLIEEVARLYGYENIPATLPHLPTRLPQENTERFKKHRARELFSYGLGFTEVYNYSFCSKKDLENCQIPEDGHIKLLNYLSEDQTHLRTTLTPNILKNIAHNIKYFPEFKLYEIGHTYKEIGEFYPLEEKWIGGAIVAKNEEPFLKAKGAIETFLQKFRISANSSAGVKNTPYAHPQKAISYIDGHGQTIAKAYTLHPQIAKNFDLQKAEVALFEINFSEALKLTNDQFKYSPLPKFPSTDFDVSVLIDKNIEIATIKNAIEESAPELIKSVTLFDIYEGANIPSTKKAIAYKVVLQAADRTLNEKETADAQQKVFKSISKINGEVRGK